MKRLDGQHFSALFDRALDAVVGMDSAGQVIAWNATAVDIFGWTQTEAIGRRMDELIVPHAHRDAHEAGLKHFNETGEGPVLEQRIKISALRKNGTEFPVELSIIPIRSEQGTIFFAFIRSLEAEERAERERESRLQEASVVASVSAALLEAMETDDFVRLCLRRICEVSGMAAGHLFSVNDLEAPTLMESSAIWYFADDSFEPAAAATNNQSFAKGQGLPGIVWATDDAVVVEDLNRESGFARVKPFAALGLTKAFAFPVRRANGIVGVMEFFGTANARADDGLQLFARTIADHVGVAIERNEDNAYREILRRELAHRVGNSLTVLASIFRRCADDSDSVDVLVDKFEPRLIAVGNAHRLFSRNLEQVPELSAIITGSLSLLPEQDAVEVRGDPVDIASSDVLPLTLIFSELVTNTIKHGIWQNDPAGKLSVEWECDPASDMLRLVWTESPSTGEVSGEQAGYGTILIDAMSEGNLQGTFTRTCTSDAFVFELTFPL